MEIRTKITLSVAGVIVLMMFLKIITDIPYRSNIPQMPDLENLPFSLQEQIKRASRKARLNPDADKLGNLGMVYNSSSFYDKASECYKLAIRRNNSKWIWHYYLGYLEKEMGETENSIKHFESVVDKKQDAWHAWFYIGESYSDLGNFDKSESALIKAAHQPTDAIKMNRTYRSDFFPLNVYARYQLSKLYINSDRINQAESILKKLTEDYPYYGSAHRLLGAIYRIKGDTLLSKKHIARSNDLLDLTVPVDTLIDLLALNSRSDLFILKKIDEAENSSYPEWALTLVNHAIKHIPDNRYLISKTIKLLLRINAGEDALIYLDKNLDNFHDNFEELKQVADLLYEKGFYSQSYEYFNHLIKLQPENTEVQANLILCLLNQGKNQEASDLMDEYVEKYSTNPKVLANAVYIMLLVKEREKARQYLAKMKIVSPSDPKAHLLAGRIAQESGDLKSAMNEYETAYRKNPSDLLSAQSLGEILIRRQMWRKAIDHFRGSLEKFPNEPYILERIGTLLTTCPDTALRIYPEGLEYLERVFTHKSCPTDIMISAGRSLALAYAATGNRTKASFYAIWLARSNNAPEEFMKELEKNLK